MEHHQIVDRTDSAANWILAKRWLKDCIDNHHKCNTQHAGVEYPTRLIQVYIEGGDRRARLCVTANCLPTGPYIALSHRWGNAEHVPRLTSHNIHQRLTGLDLSSLPKTFVDAIDTARNLNVEWLWIDSLCIIQDSPFDWQQESRVMGRIYEKAMLTISALDAADSAEGLFFHRDKDLSDLPRLRQLFSYPRRDLEVFVPVDCHFWDPVSTGVLARRAWCLQERLLSRRVLHFGKQQLYWECLCQAACEMFPKGVPEFCFQREKRTYEILVKHVDHLIAAENSLPYHHKSTDIQLDTEQAPSHYVSTDVGMAIGQSPTWVLYKTWRRIVESYCRCELTEMSDKLVAVAGLAQRMQSMLGDSYLAGLWRQNILSELLWYVESPSFKNFRPQPYRAPSWSWASMEGPITYSGDKTCVSLASLLEAKVTPSDPNNFFGQIESGFLRVRGNDALVPFSFQQSYQSYHTFIHNLPWMTESSIMASKEAP